METWLVTGGSGFLGRHVLAALLAVKPPFVRVVALGRRRPPGFPEADFQQADLEDPASLSHAVAKVVPDLVIHTAGQTPPADPDSFERVNTRGTIHLLRALKPLKRPVRVVLVGSAAELGPVGIENLPVAEEHPCQPADAYARSKWYATSAGLLARRPLDVVVARVFNPIGPGMPENQAFGRFSRRLAEPGPEPVRLPVGDLEARRDFVDVRDVAEALLTLARKGHAGLIYNVGTGHSHRVGDGLNQLILLSGRHVVIEPRDVASHGPSDSRADISRIVAHTGWRPRIEFERSVADLWADTHSRSNGSTHRSSRHVA